MSAAELMNLYEFAAEATGFLPGDAREFAADGVADEITYGRCRYFFDALGIVPRYLVDVSTIDTGATLLGRSLTAPLLLAPSIPQTLVHPKGEAASCGAASEAGIFGSVGAFATLGLEEIRSAAPGALMCEVVMDKDRARTADRVARANAAGYAAVCWTVDPPFPDELGWAVPASALESVDVEASFEEIEWLRAQSPLPVVVRGILREDDARACVAHGAHAIVVSNHWARAVDGAVPAIEALPAIVDATGGAAEIILEGGVRRGLDIEKALALGARGVMIGRPVLWGLAVAGAQGVRRVIELLTDELVWAMTMTGAARLSDLDRSFLALVPTLYETAASLALRQIEHRHSPGRVVNRHQSKSARWQRP